MTLVPTNQPDITVEVLAEQDHVQVKGNAMASGDEKFDRKVENKIYRELSNGNVWAWASVEVRMEFFTVDMAQSDEEPIVVSQYLGCCSYDSAKDFISASDGFSGYMGDMLDECHDEVLSELNEAYGGEALQDEFKRQYEAFRAKYAK